MNYGDKAIRRHRKLGGKLSVAVKDSHLGAEELSIYYTPGVAAVSSLVAKNPDKARDYTWLNNCVAVVSDGSAVLGLGDIGPYGALPVMEGKAMLFKNFANVDAVPIVLGVHKTDEIISAVKAIAPSFGGINLEDIAAPQCFEIEQVLKNELQIPVFHDDQHGTAIVVLAGLINAAKLTGRKLAACQIVISGAGAAGVATARLLKKYAPAATLFMVDSKGLIDEGRNDLNKPKMDLLSDKVIKSAKGSLADALRGTDIFIGVSAAGILKPEMVMYMAGDPIIFAMANPNPEILPEDARAAGAAVVATGRSDLPNQVNNALAFPGIFRGALDNNVQEITDKHKMAAAETIASLVKKPSVDKIVPSITDKQLVPAVAAVIR